MKILVWLGLQDELDDILGFFNRLDARLEKVLDKLTAKNAGLHQELTNAKADARAAIRKVEDELREIEATVEADIVAVHDKALQAATVRERIRDLCTR